MLDKYLNSQLGKNNARTQNLICNHDFYVNELFIIFFVSYFKFPKLRHYCKRQGHGSWCDVRK